MSDIVKDVKGTIIEIGDIVWLASLLGRSATLQPRRVLYVKDGKVRVECLNMDLTPVRKGVWDKGVWLGFAGPISQGTIQAPDRCIVDLEARKNMRLAMAVQ